MRVAKSLWGVSWLGTKRHQGQEGHLGGAQEWPREGLTKTSTNYEANVQSAQPAQAAETNQKHVCCCSLLNAKRIMGISYLTGLDCPVSSLTPDRRGEGSFPLKHTTKSQSQEKT